MTEHYHKHSQGLGHINTGYTEPNMNCLSHTMMTLGIARKGAPLTCLQRAFLIRGTVAASIPGESEYFSIRKMHIAGMQY